jgi:hypothetical protein
MPPAQRQARSPRPTSVRRSGTACRPARGRADLWHDIAFDDRKDRKDPLAQTAGSMAHRRLTCCHVHRDVARVEPSEPQFVTLV